jgi:hypothetical protein
MAEALALRSHQVLVVDPDSPIGEATSPAHFLKMAGLLALAGRCQPDCECILRQCHSRFVGIVVRWRRHN